MIRNMGIMKAQLNQIQESIDVLQDRRLCGSAVAAAVTENPDESECFKLLPITNMEQMNQFNDCISVDSKRRALVLFTDSEIN